jgi:hypothetical protein
MANLTSFLCEVLHLNNTMRALMFTAEQLSIALNIYRYNVSIREGVLFLYTLSPIMFQIIHTHNSYHRNW